MDYQDYYNIIKQIDNKEDETKKAQEQWYKKEEEERDSKWAELDEILRSEM